MKELLNKEINKICKKNRLMGANVVLFNDEQIIYSYNYGYANKGRNIKSTNDSLYMIGSNTKVMTAICILKLMEEGGLSLEDDVRKFIPEFEVKSTFDYDKITIGNLLMHRSGLVGDFFHLITDKNGDFHDVIKEIKNSYLTAKPGAMFAYSNVGFTILGIVIERVTGLTYQECVDKIIAEPLGINILFLQSKEERDLYSDTVSLCYNKRGKEVEDPLTTLLPAGSNTYMSIEDFVTFGQIFLKRDGMILSKETIELMEKLECAESLDMKLMNAGYGLLQNIHDFGENVGKIWGHGGDTMYHHSVFYYIPKQNLGVAIFTNSEQAPLATGPMADKAVISCLKDKGVVIDKNSLEYDYVSADGEEHLGKYVTGIGVCEIRKNRHGELTTKVKGMSVKMKACKDGFWQLCPNNLLLHFPPIKKELKKIRVKFTDYAGEEVVVLEQRDEYNKLQGIYGCRYEETDIPDSFRCACGRYKLVNENIKELKGNGVLRIEKGMLVVRMKCLAAKGSAYLKTVGNHLAFVQGFGRGTRNDVNLQEENGDIYLNWCGLVFKKV